MWPAYITESFRTFWCEKGSSMCRYHDDDFSRSIIAYGESNNMDKERNLIKVYSIQKIRMMKYKFIHGYAIHLILVNCFTVYVSYSIHLVKHLNL